MKIRNLDSRALSQFVFETVKDHPEAELEAVLGCGRVPDIRHAFQPGP
jgi:hypothetical protein